jgi:hypothetical protein
MIVGALTEIQLGHHQNKNQKLPLMQPALRELTAAHTLRLSSM